MSTIKLFYIRKYRQARTFHETRLGGQLVPKNTVKYTVKKLQLAQAFQLKKLNYFNLYSTLKEKKFGLTM